MARQYIVYEKPSAGEVFGSFLMMLVIVGFVVLIAAYISWIILIVFAAIGAAIGLCYALYVYIRAFIRAVGTGYTPKSNGVVLGLLEKLFVISATTSSTAFSDSIGIASNAVARSRAYRVISFRKWMWLIAALSIMVFGLCLIAAVILLEFSLLIGAVCVLLGILAVICLLYFVTALGYALFFAEKFSLSSAADQLDFSGFGFHLGTGFYELGCSASIFYASFGRMIAQMWSETHTLAQNNFSDAMSRPIFSVPKWLYLVSPVPLYFWTTLLSGLAAVLLTLEFILIFLAFFLFTCFSKLVSLLHR